ncbi:2-keto-4-pentenoate hydratase/2-oxohepta-3-ene-1,7-dioic acid hydratase in catechol pathway [Scopulibacillus darangshiensis]|uniref:2-keto-4-pentenoate hydratase/2-oxohepta-3-ene-1,7-dioic acid hydratase in catechol pathway n=1 Tax=Scopulibacillus darangshiensis TaxID=442528 RepID=A0A4R2P4R7_9BACL|nr:fumarylacetoacetate hydrolase family protein [Scopulibacillus darangshiensis]TCP29647.1 2-keto-4-pentenoate hydratase/2-oxohepta-3-ene-1,7-dioic acid hydratase in catechol pathway [Scopulibacillus darangshiensis]
MKFVSYSNNSKEHLGLKEDKGILPIGKLLNDENIRIDKVIHNPEKISQIKQLLNNESISDSDYISEESVTFLPSVPEPKKIICIGKNYAEHAKETNDDIPEEPIVFSKFSDSAAAHMEDVPLPDKSDKVDYEAELAVIIGKRAEKVLEEEALQYVFGYSNANDLSARDLQFKSGQWLLGKTCPKFAPIGPYLITADEVGDPQNLNIRLFLNGEERQSSNTKHMIFTVKYLIHYLSQYMVLSPGDVILSGTPEGVILGHPDEKQSWLKPGDEVYVEIDKLGVLKNTLK